MLQRRSTSLMIYLSVLQASVDGLIQLKDVNFYYPTRATVQVLKSYSITAQPGQMVALVGTSGCGKSTTVQLLERFYDATSGSVVSGIIMTLFFLKLLITCIAIF